MRTNPAWKRRWGGLLAIGLVATVLALPRHARQALADRVPADAVVYVGWKGGDSLGPAYEASQLKGVADAANLKQQVASLLARAVDDAAKRGDQQGAAAKLLRSAVETMAKYPTAFYFGGLDLTDPDQPLPKLAILCESGKDVGATLADQLTKASADAPNRKVPLIAKVVGNYLVVSTGETGKPVEALLAKPDGPSLATEPAFVAALGQVTQKDPLIVVYASGDKLLRMTNDAVTQGNNTRAQQIWPRVVAILGLNGFQNALFTGGFDGRLWSTQAFVKLAKDRAGLPGLLDTPPLTEATLKMLPKDAAWAGVLQFDGPRLLADLRNGAALQGQNGAQQFDQMLALAKGFLGVDLQKDLLAALGTEWVYYGGPDSAGASVRGLTVINKLKDEKALAKTMETLADFANGIIAQRAGADSKVSIKTQNLGDLDVTTLTLPDSTPSWTISGGCLVISTSPQGVQAAAQRLAKPGPSILENEDYTALVKKLGVAKPSGVAFTDLPRTAADSYALLTKLAARLAAQAAGKDAPFTLPPLDKITPWLSPMASVTWTDEAGWHLKGLSPFPGSGLLNGGDAWLRAVAEGRGMAPFGQGRANAPQTARTKPLQTLGTALKVYDAENGVLPNNLDALLGKRYLGDDAATLKILAGPNVTVPDDILHATREQQAAWLSQNTIYTYLGAGKKLAAIAKPAETVLAYEKLDLPTSRRGVAMLFADGHVEFVPRARVDEMPLK